MPVEWALLAQWAGGARTAAGLFDIATSKKLVEAMDSIGGVHMTAAASLLREAEHMPVEVRHREWERAVTNLDVAYTAFVRRPSGLPGFLTRALSAKRYARALGDAAAVAAVCAGVRAALEHDGRLVESRLTNGVKHLYQRHVYLWIDACSGRPMPFDFGVSQRLADEQLNYIECVRAIASHSGVTQLPEPRTWPHERDPRFRMAPAPLPATPAHPVNAVALRLLPPSRLRL